MSGEPPQSRTVCTPGAALWVPNAWNEVRGGSKARGVSWAWTVGPRPLPLAASSPRPWLAHRFSAIRCGGSNVRRAARASATPSCVPQPAPEDPAVQNCSSRHPPRRASLPPCAPTPQPPPPSSAHHSSGDHHHDDPAPLQPLPCPPPPPAPTAITCLRRLFYCNRVSSSPRFSIAKTCYLIPRAQLPSLESILRVPAGLSG